MRVDLQFVDVPGGPRPMRAALARPVETGDYPGIVLYSDIFQLTPSTLRTVVKFASYGFTVLAPEIYYRREASGTAWEFDDAGRAAGMAAAKATPVADFDADAELATRYLAQVCDDEQVGAVGFCLGGHLAFRAALLPRVAATVCYYPTGLQNGALGADADSGSLARAGEIQGFLHVVFGTEDPHVPADARAMVEARLEESRIALRLSHFDANHAFMRDEGPRYDPALADQAYMVGIATLREALGVVSAPA